jgi:hypothetical protein
MNMLTKIFAEPAYSLKLNAKLMTVTKAKRHTVRKITDEEADELGGENDWLMFNGRQTVIERRECGQWIVWAF